VSLPVKRAAALTVVITRKRATETVMDILDALATAAPASRCSWTIASWRMTPPTAVDAAV
jgi:hypothetical protein